MTSVVGDIFRGDFVRDYVTKRAAKEAWGLEHAALCRLIDKCERGIRVLDVPFGTGRFVEEYLSRGMSIAGLDISPAMFEEAKAELGEIYNSCRLTVGTAAELPYENNSFDLVVSFRFLSGIVDSATAIASMREFHRVAPRAILQLKCRNPKLAPIDLPKPHEKLGVAYYRKDMDALFESAGYRIDAEEQIDNDPKGIRWAFLVSRI